jgi:hypothetical protein
MLQLRKCRDKLQTRIVTRMSVYTVQKTLSYKYLFILLEEKICPSSVAAYFSSRGHKVLLCQPRFSKQVSYNVKVPEFFSSDDGEDDSALELIEWLGAFSIGADL